MEGVIRILEIDDPNAPVPEERLAVAETPAPSVSAHPNGAFGLIEAILCVHENDLQEFLLRYEEYLNVKARAENNLNIFELGGSRLTSSPR
ncbi:hypothetical protein CEB3_c02350 [Peptococcaceae bacterium CEB3]|nr:hypothetical protein CEB3_c02350 [Peptococcaceae bacterium CEB3]